MRTLTSRTRRPGFRSPLPWLSLAALLGGCTQATVPADTAEGEAVAAAGEDHAACGEDGKADEAHDCTHGAGTAQLTDDRVEVRTVDGREVLHAGRPFGEAEAVAVADLLEKPAAYAGKTVRIAGDVAAMCTHRRGWFAVTAGDTSGRTVRVITAPTFLVPQGSVGRSAVTEGTVELIEVDAAFAEHLAEGHKLEKPEEGRAKVQQVILRAAGADFS